MTAFPRMPSACLDHVAAVNFGVRRRMSTWAPSWLCRLWPRWPVQESDRAFRRRLVRIPRSSPRGTAGSICERVADVLRCRPKRIVVTECGPQEFTVSVPRRLTAQEREDVRCVIDYARPAYTRCVAVKEP
jgi:hypothetical protein